MTVLLIFSTSAAAENSGVSRISVRAGRRQSKPYRATENLLPTLAPPATGNPVFPWARRVAGRQRISAGRHWAAGGYIAVFMQHAGSDEQVWKSAPREKRRETLFLAANVQNFLHRNRDVSFVIDTLEVWNRHQAHALNGGMDLEPHRHERRSQFRRGDDLECRRSEVSR